MPVTRPIVDPSERGHVGPTLASIIAIAAAIVAGVGIGNDSDTILIIGVVLFAI